MPNAAQVGRSQIQHGALAVGGIFALIGFAGFVPGITQPYDQMRFATAESQAYLLGIVQVSVLHNLIHLATAAGGVVCARRARWARNYLITAGVFYMLLFFYGLTVRLATDSNLIPMNDAGNALNVIAGLGMLALGVVLDSGAGWRQARHSRTMS